MDLEITTDLKSCWVIAYGNLQRGDDGVAGEVARKLIPNFENSPEVGICVLPQLDLSILDEIQSAETLIFIDASVQHIPDGVRWSKIEPELNGWAMGSHQVEPKVFVGLLQLLYSTEPSAWMVSVQGHDFRLGAELSRQARRNADKAAVQIVDWLFKHNVALPTQTIEKRGLNHG